MATSRRLRVRIDSVVWAEEVERLAPRSSARTAAERERPVLLREGLNLIQLLPCDAVVPDGTSLRGLVKTYVPIGARPPSERPFGFVFDPDRDERGPYLDLVAFGLRHPQTRATRSVYERAHRRLHGRYPPT